jgi:hypothetical protein
MSKRTRICARIGEKNGMQEVPVAFFDETNEHGLEFALVAVVFGLARFFVLKNT